MGRLRAGRRRGGDGRRARRLVRRHRAVPPPARPADPAHGDHPQAQGPDRAQPRRVRAGQLPHPRGARRAARRRPRRPAARALARRAGATPSGRRARSPTPCGGAIEVLDDRDVQDALGGLVERRLRADRGRPAARQGDRRRRRGRPPPAAARRRADGRGRRSSTTTGRRCASASSRSRRGGCPSRSTTASSTRSSAACSASSPTSRADPRPRGARRRSTPASRALAERLRNDPEMIAKGEELKHELLVAPRGAGVAAVAVGRARSGRCWRRPTTPTASCAAASTDGLVRGRRAAWRPTPSCRPRSTTGSSASLVYVVDNYQGEVADLIASTVERWDGADTSRRIELQVGRDLQFIRINGTVVGGLAGLAIHTVGELFALSPPRCTRTGPQRPTAVQSMRWRSAAMTRRRPAGDRAARSHRPRRRHRRRRRRRAVRPGRAPPASPPCACGRAYVALCVDAPRRHRRRGRHRRQLPDRRRARPTTCSASTAAALADGADEIDVVLPYRAWLAGDDRPTPPPCSTACAIARGAPSAGTDVKVIIESGELPDRAADRPGDPLRHRPRRRLRQDVDRQDAGVGDAGGGRDHPRGDRACPASRSGSRRPAASARSPTPAPTSSSPSGSWAPGGSSPATFRFGASGLLDDLVTAALG